MLDFGTNLVLVTGALGWLGSRLVEVLAHGMPHLPEWDRPPVGLKVRCLVLPGQDFTSLIKLSDAVGVLTGDLRFQADCERFCWNAKGAVLFHTAGVIHPRFVHEFYQVNRDGTANLLEAAARAGVRRVVVVSSNSPCGCNPHPDHLFDEESPYRPYMNYGRSKMQMEQLVKRYSARLETVIIRAPWFYGPNQPARQTLFFKLIRTGKVPVVGTGDNLRSMVYIDNLCQGLLLAAASEAAAGQTYWIADSRPYTMNEIIDTVERILETEFGIKCAHKRVRLPGFVSTLAYVADACIQTLGLYNQKIHVLSEMNKTIACSIAKAARELGYKPKIELEEGMRRSLQWCINRGIKL
ncbi:MAG: NAD(P)-dependent oxidoreductase [Verrucomicrobiae bacterium]|nr:NAD(P)-dependent oxidoreductase [Verrucomicrobiae bacterium]